MPLGVLFLRLLNLSFKNDALQTTIRNVQRYSKICALHTKLNRFKWASIKTSWPP